MTPRRFKVDFLSSSSDDDQSSVSLETNSSTCSPHQGKTGQLSSNGIGPGSAINALSKTLDAVKIWDSTSSRKGTVVSSIDLSMLDSSDDDDSIIENYRRVQSPKIIGLDGYSDESFSSETNARRSMKPSSNPSRTSCRPSPEKSKSKSWRHSITMDEYTVSEDPSSNTPHFRIPRRLFDNLYNHQKEGVAWMVGLHGAGVGGLLGDDMGMGKTYQTLTFLGGMMRARSIRNALIVAPVSVLRSWEREANVVVKMCVSNVCIKVVSSDINKKTRQRLLRSALECPSNRPNLIICTYGLIQSSVDDFTHESFDWDYVVLDEAHKIKNTSTDIAKNIRFVANGDETRRLILTGTPIMNNLRELWALFDFVTSGKLLGPLVSFNTRYQRPIEDSRNKDATKFQIEAGQKANLELQEKLKPYLLQRLKVDFMADNLPTKSDFVVWTHLSERQREMYAEYVDAKDSAVADILSGVKSSPLEAITWLKKLCGHPILVLKKANNPALPSPSDLKKDSVKLQVLDALVAQLRKQGHRILIFSQSTRMLDIIQKVLRDQVEGISRIDGSTKEKDRQRLVDSFNEPRSTTQVMLLSTGAGGVGLTLTGADRAIIYDPSWNPAEDSQAVDRCYRIGQKKDVTVYRFIAAGTVEEKMYEKQVHKDGIRRAVVTNVGSALTRYFDKHDLKQIFKLNPAGQCDFLERVRDKTRTSRNEIFHRGVVGISSHDMLYTEPDEMLGDNQRLDAGSQENPFSSPTRGASLIPLQASNFDNSNNSGKVLGKSQRALNKGAMGNENDAIPLRQLGTRTNKEVQSNTDKSSPDQSFESLIKEVDSLAAGGQREDAMEILMDTMDARYDKLNNSQKMKIHSRMSSIAYELRWL